MPSFLSKVKGNFCIDPSLGNKVVLPDTSVKIRKQGRCDELQYGIDVVRTTDRAMKSPGAVLVDIVVQDMSTCIAAPSRDA